MQDSAKFGANVRPFSYGLEKNNNLIQCKMISAFQKCSKFEDLNILASHVIQKRTPPIKDNSLSNRVLKK